MEKFILTCAITGGIHTPGMSSYFPYTPEDIINEAVKANEAGAAIVHIHARNPENGEPTSDLDIMKKIVAGIKQRCDVVICITTGGSLGMSIEERLKPIPELQPELASLNAGSIDFVISPMAKKLEPKYNWEIPYLENTDNLVFANTFNDIENFIKTMNDNGTKPEFEVYDVGMINNIAYFVNKGLIKEPVYLQFVMGILGGIPAEVEHLVHMVQTAERLIEDFKWSVIGAGKKQFPLTATGLAMGGSVRVGLEDNLYLRPGQKAKSNAEQVIQIKEIAERLGFQPATPNEAREILKLKGKENVDF